MNRLFVRSAAFLAACILPAALYGQSDSPGARSIGLGSAPFAAGEKVELLIAHSIPVQSPAAGESSLVIADSAGNEITEVELPNLAAFVAPSGDGTVRWVNAVTVEVVGGALVVNGQDSGAIQEEKPTHTRFFANYRPQFYFRTTDVTRAPPHVMLTVLGAGGEARAARELPTDIGGWTRNAAASRPAGTPVSVHPTEQISLTFERIERTYQNTGQPVRQSAVLVFADAFGQRLGSIDLPADGSSSIWASVDGGVLNVDGQALGAVYPDPYSGRTSVMFWIMNQDFPASEGASGADAPPIDRFVHISAVERASGQTRAQAGAYLSNWDAGLVLLDVSNP